MGSRPGIRPVIRSEENDDEDEDELGALIYNSSRTARARAAEAVPSSHADLECERDDCRSDRSLGRNDGSGSASTRTLRKEASPDAAPSSNDAADFGRGQDDSHLKKGKTGVNEGDHEGPENAVLFRRSCESLGRADQATCNLDSAKPPSNVTHFGGQNQPDESLKQKEASIARIHGSEVAGVAASSDGTEVDTVHHQDSPPKKSNGHAIKSKSEVTEITKPLRLSRPGDNHCPRCQKAGAPCILHAASPQTTAEPPVLCGVHARRNGADLGQLDGSMIQNRGSSGSLLHGKDDVASPAASGKADVDGQNELNSSVSWNEGSSGARIPGSEAAEAAPSNGASFRSDQNDLPPKNGKTHVEGEKRRRKAGGGACILHGASPRTKAGGPPRCSRHGCDNIAPDGGVCEAHRLRFQRRLRVLYAGRHCRKKEEEEEDSVAIEAREAKAKKAVASKTVASKATNETGTIKNHPSNTNSVHNDAAILIGNDDGLDQQQCAIKTSDARKRGAVCFGKGDGAAPPKRLRKICSTEGCSNIVIQGGVCTRHGAKRIYKICSTEGCSNITVQGGVCTRHGAKRTRKICIHEGCTNYAKKRGVCTRHGATRPTCNYEGCTNESQNGGVCFRHGAKRPECSHEECTNYARKGGVCKRHGANKM